MSHFGAFLNVQSWALATALGCRPLNYRNALILRLYFIHKGIKEMSLCIWRAHYIHECHSYKQGLILCLLQKTGRKKLCLLVDVRWYLTLTKKLEELFSLDNWWSTNVEAYDGVCLPASWWVKSMGEGNFQNAGILSFLIIA